MKNAERAVEILGDEKEGSGFLIGPGLVLTAWHNLRPDGNAPLQNQFDVRILGEYQRADGKDRLNTRRAEILWPLEDQDEDHDFALLRIVDRTAGPDEVFIDWAELEGAEQIGVDVIGFPDYAKFSNTSINPADPQSERDTATVRGIVHLGSRVKQLTAYDIGTFVIVVRQQDLDVCSIHDWEGISGAPVFAGPLLIGVTVRAEEGRAGVHQLHALPVSRLFKSARNALRDARITLPRAALMTVGNPGNSDFTSEILDQFGVARNAPSDFRAGVEIFLNAYLGEPGRRVPFGGRGAMLDKLNDWLNDPTMPHRLLLHAPGGRGKSALVVKWLLDVSKQSKLIFLPISARSETNLSRLFYEALAKRLAEILGVELAPPIGIDPEEHYCRIATNSLRRLKAGDKPVLLVIDGLDEAAGWQLPPTLLPDVAPAGLRILVSARERAGDLGPEGWFRRLGWERSGGSPASLSVDRLNEDGVVEVLSSVDASFADSDNAKVAAQIARLSNGDPWIVKLYAEDLRKEGSNARRLQPDDLAGMQPGFAAFFSDWLEDQRQIWEQLKHPVDETSLESVLAILACAQGPLRHHELAQICRCWRGPDFVLSRGGIEPVDRFILGDGKASGYVLAHPQFADFLRSGYFDDPMPLLKAREALLRWGLNTLSELEGGRLAPASCPSYLLTYLGQHLVEAQAPAEDFMRLVGEGWLGAWYHAEGGYRGFSLDARRAQDAVAKLNADDKRYWAWLLRCHMTTSSIVSTGSQIPGWLVVACVKAERLTGHQGLYLLEQRALQIKPQGTDRTETPSTHAKALVALAEAWPEAPDRAEGIGQILRAVASIKSGFAQAEALVGLSSLLPDALLRDAVGIALSITYDSQRVESLTALLPSMSLDLRAEAMRTVLASAVPATVTAAAAGTIKLLGRSLPSELLSGTLAVVQAEAEAQGGAEGLARVLVAAAICLLETANGAFVACLAVSDEDHQANMLSKLIPLLPESLIDDALAASLALGEIRQRWIALHALFPRLSESHLPEVTQKIMQWDAPYQRASALNVIASRIVDANERALLFLKAVEAVDAVGDDEKVRWLLLELASNSPTEHQGFQLVVRALRSIESIDSETSKRYALESIARHLPAALFEEALRLALEIKDEFSRSRALLALAHHAPDALVSKFFEIAISSIKRDAYRIDVLAVLIPKLPKPLHPDAMDAVSGLVNKGDGRVLLALIPGLPDNSLGWALAEALVVSSEFEQHQAFQLIISRMSMPTLERTLAILGSTLDEPSRFGTLAFIKLLPASLMPAVLDILQKCESDFARADVLNAVASSLPAPLLDEALQIVKAFRFKTLRAKTLVAIAPLLSDKAERNQAFSDALQALGEEEHLHEGAKIMESLLPDLPSGLIGQALDLIEHMTDHKDRGHVLECIAGRLPDDLLIRALRVAREIALPDLRARALAALAKPFSSEALRADLLDEALKGLMAISDEEARVSALASLVPHLTESAERTEALDEALSLANSIFEKESRIRALGRIAPFRSDTLHALLQEGDHLNWDNVASALTTVLPVVEHRELVFAISAIADERERVAALIALVRHLPDQARPDFIELGLNTTNDWHLTEFIRKAAPYFGPAYIEKAAKTARRIKSKLERGWAMEDLKPYRPQSGISRLLQRLPNQRPVSKAEETLRKAATYKEIYRARALIDLKQPLSPDLSIEALRLCASIDYDHFRARALEGLMPFLADTQKADALRLASEIEMLSARGIAIAGIASTLPKHLLDETLRLVEEIDDPHGFTTAVTGLSPHLNETQRQRAIASASDRLTYGTHRVNALTVLGSTLPLGPMRTELLSDALRTSESIDEDANRLEALRLLLPHLPDDLKEQALRALLQAAGRLPRVHLLETIPVLMKVINSFRSGPALSGIYHAVRDVGRWFPVRS